MYLQIGTMCANMNYSWRERLCSTINRLNTEIEILLLKNEIATRQVKLRLLPLSLTSFQLISRFSSDNSLEHTVATQAQTESLTTCTEHVRSIERNTEKLSVLETPSRSIHKRFNRKRRRQLCDGLEKCDKPNYVETKSFQRHDVVTRLFQH